MEGVLTVPATTNNSTAQLALGAAAIGFIAGGYAAYKSYKNGKAIEQGEARQAELSRRLDDAVSSMNRAATAIEAAASRAARRSAPERRPARRSNSAS